VFFQLLKMAEGPNPGQALAQSEFRTDLGAAKAALY